MEEAQIVESLKTNIPQDTTTIAAPVVGDSVETPVALDLDEITQYKVLQHFGEQLTNDPQIKEQIGYIYKEISDRIGTQEYPFVVAKMNELMRMLGFSNATNPRFRLYQWLKLDQKRTNIEMEMNNVVGQPTA